MTEKGQSPFYPGQPVPVELFVGRAGEVERIRRAARQVAAGKPQAIFISGEYGIGKSSLARFVRFAAEREPGLLGFHVLLGTSDTLEEVSLLRLRSLYKQNRSSYRGLILELGATDGTPFEEELAFALKNLVDANALDDEPVPLLLLLCGTEEQRRRLIAHHRPIERIFEIVQVGLMEDSEIRAFFQRAFGNAQMDVTDEAMDLLCRFSGGQPTFMHRLGEAAFRMASGMGIEASLVTQVIQGIHGDPRRERSAVNMSFGID